MRVYYNVNTRELRAAEERPAGTGWRTLPKMLGIQWHPDQSQNQLLFHWRGAQANYIFNPASDMALLEEYRDQIEEHYE